MATIEISPATRMFYLAQSAHGHVDTAKSALKRYSKEAKNLTDARGYKTMLESCKEATSHMSQALANWATIEEILRLNPDLQEEA
jgi:hypothetical protein